MQGYLKVKPWITRSTCYDDLACTKANVVIIATSSVRETSPLATPRSSHDQPRGHNSTADIKQPEKSSASAAPGHSSSQPQSYRLFGTYMNSVVTFQDGNTAWLSSEGMISWVTSSVYEKLGGGGFMSGVKLTRGFPDPIQPKDKDEKIQSSPTVTPSSDDKKQKLLKRRSAPPTTHAAPAVESRSQEPTMGAENPHARLQRQLSSLMEPESKDPIMAEEQINRREEQVIQDDYNAQAGEAQGRDIEHLILVTHGIGQLLGLRCVPADPALRNRQLIMNRMESVNFVHDVNMMRKTLKSVYAGSEDLKALNSELVAGPGNCRVQVLPVCWRHLLDFPKRREKKNEHDLADTDGEEDECKKHNACYRFTPANKSWQTRPWRISRWKAWPLHVL